jgi:hypothetical protein
MTMFSYHFYHIIVSERVQLYKARVQDDNKRIVEWEAFSELRRIKDGRNESCRGR